MDRCRTDGSVGGVSGTTNCLAYDSHSQRRSWRFFLLRGLSVGIRRLGLILLLATAPNSAALAQSQNFIDFEEFSGPTVFTGIQPPLTVGLATFSGGQILDATNFLPANPTSVYGTAFFCSGCLPTLTIDFAEPVSDLSMFLMNGQTFVVTYFVEDDQGGMTQITLPSNFNSGAGTVMLPSSGIRKATISGSASAWDFFIDNISFVAEQEEFMISFSAFIPADNVGGGPSEFCLNFDFMRPFVQLFFKGDDRTFSPTAGSFRVRELVTGIASESADPDGLKEGSIQRLVGQTRSYASDALADGKIDQNDEDGIANDCVLFHDAATASNASMSVAVSRLTADSVQLELDGGPGNPLSLAARSFGTLDWDFTITIDTSTGTPEWTLTGRHDGFPAYEIYINDTEIYRHFPGAPPYTFRDHVSKLLGRLDVDVGNLSGTLP